MLVNVQTMVDAVPLSMPKSVGVRDAIGYPYLGRYLALYAPIWPCKAMIAIKVPKRFYEGKLGPFKAL